MFMYMGMNSQLYGPRAELDGQTSGICTTTSHFPENARIGSRFPMNPSFPGILAPGIRTGPADDRRTTDTERIFSRFPRGEGWY